MKAQTQAVQTNETVADLPRLLTEGWKVVSDGPSGVQVAGMKKMDPKDKVCLWVGIATCWFGVGLLFIAIALIDFYAITKPPTKFLPRI